MKKLIALLVVFFFAGTCFAQITGSAHDFSGNAWSNGQICLPCHTPHNATGSGVGEGAPLWNHDETTATFTLYTTAVSSTYDASGSQPDGASKLCLSCHDGTIALDSFGGGAGTAGMISGTANFGTDLSNDHPISFTYDDALATTDGELHSPTTTLSGITGGGNIDDDLLFGAGNNRMECASCHDVHNKNTVVNTALLRIGISGSLLCLTCHDK